MPKKKLSKKRAISPKKKQGSSSVYIGVAIIAVGIISLLTLTKLTFSSTHVLGASTLLARGGDDSGEDSGGGNNSGSGSSGGESTSGGSGGSNTSGGSSSGGSGSSNTGGSGTSGGDSIGSSNTSVSANTQNVSGGTTVNCTGPDGKVFQTTASNCENLNKQWNHPVSFTVVNTPKKIDAPRPTHMETENEKVQKSTGTIKQADKNNEIETEHGVELENGQEPVEVESKDHQVKMNLKKHGTVIELRSSQGRIDLQAKQEDGTQVELSDDSLKTVNDELAKANESEIEQDTEGAFVLKHGSKRAKTSLPISVNLVTNELNVTTSKGTKVVTVLPDDAVNKLVNLKLIDRVEPETNDIVNLTEVNDKPVFEVKGIDDQRLLGVVPVKIHKTVHISAEDGTVETTIESFGQKILDLVSF